MLRAAAAARCIGPGWPSTLVPSAAAAFSRLAHEQQPRSTSLLVLHPASQSSYSLQEALRLGESYAGKRRQAVVFSWTSSPSTAAQRRRFSSTLLDSVLAPAAGSTPQYVAVGSSTRLRPSPATFFGRGQVGCYHFFFFLKERREASCMPQTLCSFWPSTASRAAHAGGGGGCPGGAPAARPRLRQHPALRCVDVDGMVHGAWCMAASRSQLPPERATPAPHAAAQACSSATWSGTGGCRCWTAWRSS